MDESDEDDDSVYGDFEDLEMGEKYGGEANDSLEDNTNLKSTEE